jgi:predicted nucleotidyltransferase
MLERVTAAVRADGRFEALLGAGSLAYGGFDEYSDLDFVIVVRADAHGAAMAERKAFAQRLGSLLAAFGGEHVGEARLLICLFGPPLLHVDLKFVTPGDLATLSEHPVVLWARDPDDLERRLARMTVSGLGRDAQWYEDRAWVWLHYVATKLLRGEHFEAIGGLDFFRDQVLGAMLQRNAGRRPRGVRRVEDVEGAKALLAPTLPSTGHRSIAEALKRSAALYVELREAELPRSPVKGMPGLLLDFIDGKQSRA